MFFYAILLLIGLIFILLWIQMNYAQHPMPLDYSYPEQWEESMFENDFYTNQVNDIAFNKTDLVTCQVPTLNTEQCYKSRYYECPIVNGSYLQCTNNYIPKPTEYNADCGNRTFDMVPYPWKFSENCYYQQSGFNREKEFKKYDYTN